MATLVVGRQRAVDLLPGQRRPARSRAGAALDHPADGEAADDRGVLVQEVDRPAVPLPRQLARPHRELPHDDVRGAVGAVRGQPDGRARAQAAADPARRPRAELLDLDRAPGRLVRRQPLRVDRGRHQRAVGSAARRREPGRRSRCSRAIRDDGGDVDKYVAAGQGPRRRLPPLGLRSPRVQELRPAGPHPQGHRRARARRARVEATSCFDIALELEQVALTDEYFIERKLYPNVDFYSGLIYRAMGFPTNMFPVLFAIGRLPGWIAHWKEDAREPEDEDRPPAPDLHRARPSASTSRSRTVASTDWVQAPSTRL